VAERIPRVDRADTAQAREADHASSVHSSQRQLSRSLVVERVCRVFVCLCECVCVVERIPRVDRADKAQAREADQASSVHSSQRQLNRLLVVGRVARVSTCL